MDKLVSSGSKSCRACPSGFVSIYGKEKCDQCKAGSFTDVEQTSCVSCVVGLYSSEIGATSVSVCAICPVGTYSSAKGVTKEKDCIKCAPGRWSNTVKATSSSDCKPCAIDSFNADEGRNTSCEICALDITTLEEGQTICLGCKAGFHMKKSVSAGSKSCRACPSGFVAIYGKKKCDQCLAGTFTNTDQTSCFQCGKGLYSKELGASFNSSCIGCPSGTYSSAKGVTKVEDCIGCRPGKWSHTVGATLDCIDCPGGWLQGESGQDSCNPVKAGAIVLGSGSASVPVPTGSYLTDCHGNTCTGFSSCPTGWIGNDLTGDETLKQSCMECEAGKSSTQGSMACRTCAKGTFGKSKASHCTNCPMNWFQPQDKLASTRCISCPSGWEQNLEGESSCVDLGGIKPEDCSDKQYWIQNKDNTEKAGCNACPAGGACKGKDITISNILPLFGWWPVPDDIGEFSEPVFVECLYHPACLGEPNLALEKKYKINGTDLALVVAERNINSTVDTNSCDSANGYRNNCTGVDSTLSSANCTSNCFVQCRLCATCKKGYKRVRNAAQCQKCPGSAENKLWLGLGFFIMILGTTVLVYMEINSETSENETSDTVKKNYIKLSSNCIFSWKFTSSMAKRNGWNV